MTWHAVGIVGLSLLGLGLELWGLWLALGAVRTDVSAAREIEATPPSDLRLTVQSSLRIAWEDHRTKPPPEARLDRVEEVINLLGQQQTQEREEVQDYVNKKVAHVDRSSFDRDERIGAFIADRLKGDQRQRRLGIALFAFGAFCSAGANAWGALT